MSGKWNHAMHAMVLLAVAIPASMFWAKQNPQDIIARRIVLIGEGGNAEMVLDGGTAESGASLAMNDSNGEAAIVIEFSQTDGGRGEPRLKILSKGIDVKISGEGFPREELDRIEAEMQRVSQRMVELGPHGIAISDSTSKTALTSRMLAVSEGPDSIRALITGSSISLTDPSGGNCLLSPEQIGLKGPEGHGAVSMALKNLYPQLAGTGSKGEIAFRLP
jgi:hypothetical protein